MSRVPLKFGWRYKLSYVSVYNRCQFCHVEGPGSFKNKVPRAKSCPPSIDHFAGGSCGSKRKAVLDETRPILVETDRGQHVLCRPQMQRQVSGQT